MRRPAQHTGKRRQRGIALMLMLAIMIMGIAAALIGSLTTAAVKNARQQTTSNALVQAKEALIGRAVTDNNMPGSLPCPDLVTDIPGTNIPNDGIADLLSGNDCPSYIGRLPWKTLGLPDLRDGDGERLWYALSPSFRDDDSARPLNSNTKGSLLVYRTDGTSLLTEAGYSAVAVIFSPGRPLDSQSRNNATEQNNAANYLDIANSRNNAIAGGPFIAAAGSESFNDQLIFITTKHLMPLVEQRVASEVKRVLTNYYTNSGCSCYPWADTIDQWIDYDSNVGLNRGWIPNNALPVDWAEPFLPPDWFFENQWYKLIYYSVARDRAPPGTCDTCSASNMLNVDSDSAGALFFMPGTFAGNRSDSSPLSDYLEDAENKDDNDDNYITPTSQAGDRDRLYRLP